MAEPRAPEGETARAGPVRVRTDPAEVAAFAEALGWRGGCGAVPLTFPVRWLGLPELRTRLARALGIEGRLLVQQSQSFAYRERLAPDRDYLIEVEARRGETIRKISLHATVRGECGDIVAAAGTELRLVDGTSFGPPAHRPPPSGRSDLSRIEAGPFDALRIRRYASASLDDNPLHADPAIARSVGLEGLIVPGMMVMGQFARAAMAWRPDLTITRLYGAFLQPLPAGSRIILSGRTATSSPDREGERVILRVFAASEQGDLIVVGEIEGLAPFARAGRRAAS